MNYQKLYDNLIKKRQLTPFDGINEKHHIIPRCIGGSNALENLIKLSLREHFIAHLILVKLYPTNTSLIYAANMLSNFRQQNSKKYAWLKSKHSHLMSIRHKGKTWSEETRNKHKLLIVSDDARKNMSIAQTGKKRSESHKQIISQTHKGKKLSEETKNKISEKLKIHKPSVESNLKRSETLRGRSSPMKGKISPMKGQPRSPEVLQKAWETRRKNLASTDKPKV